jgi:hypothetical protein
MLSLTALRVGAGKVLSSMAWSIPARHPLQPIQRQLRTVAPLCVSVTSQDSMKYRVFESVAEVEQTAHSVEALLVFLPAGLHLRHTMRHATRHAGTLPKQKVPLTLHHVHRLLRLQPFLPQQDPLTHAADRCAFRKA